MSPVTSVMMPAHNAESTIVQSIESALAQTVSDLEVIVVDDGSSDGTADAVLAVRDPRVRLIRHRSNRGVSAARNSALEAARAPLVSVLDADDWWDPDYLESILPALGDPAVGLAYANCRFLRNPAAADYLPHLAGVDLGVMEPWLHPVDRFPELTESCPVPALTVTMRRDAVRAAGGYAPWLYCGSDWHLYVKLAKAGWRFAYVDRVLASYRWPEPGRGMSFDIGRRELNNLKLWSSFAVQHPLTPGVWRRTAHDARAVLLRRAPFLRALKNGLQRTAGSAPAER